MNDRTDLPDSIVLDGESLIPEDVITVSRHDAPVELAAESREWICESRERVESVFDSNESVYSVNTDFGHLVKARIDRENIKRLQMNPVRNHAANASHELTREEA